MVDIQGVKFPGYGRCIYCGSTGPLKDEHIIPFSLGGKAVIEAASSGECKKVTNCPLSRPADIPRIPRWHEIAPAKGAAF